MSYPKIHLTRPYRIALMVFWIVLFFVIAPITILYTAGYRYDFSTHTIKQTGVISVDITPRDATIFLNNIDLDRNIPLRLTNRAPGNYHLRLFRDGYHDWEKTIRVDSNQTTYIRNITMLQQHLPYSFLPDAYFSLSSLYPRVAGNSLLFSTADDGVYELYRLTIDGDIPQASLLLRQSFASAPHISWSRDGSLFLVDMTDLGGRLFVFDHDEQRSSIDGPLLSPPQWHDQHGLVVMLDDTLFSLRPDQDISSLAYTPTSSMWYLDDANTLWEFDSISRRIEQFDSAGTRLHTMELDQEYTITSFVHVDDSRLLLETADGILFVSPASSASTQFFSGANATYNAQTGAWLVWSSTELWSIFPDGSVALLERTGQPLRGVYPLDKDGLLLLVKGNVLEAYNPGYEVRHSLFEFGEEVEQVAVDVDSRQIFLLGTIGERRDLFVLEY